MRSLKRKKPDSKLEALKTVAPLAAERLLGALLIREFPEGRAVVRIVETEAYDQTDAASHSYKGQTPRTDVMFGPAGYLYVYFTYGMHYCANVVVGSEGEGAAVLIRAVEPLEGHELLQQRRQALGRELTNGPAKLCQALVITKVMNGHDLAEAPLRLELQDPLPSDSIVRTTRIGISRDTHRPWRFFVKDNPYVSKLAQSGV
jgi:DNA-3-methyladenine glycosylase